MAYEYYNPNPIGKRTGDCIIRALCKVLDMPWMDVHVGLALQGLEIYETMESNATWDLYLRKKGYKRYAIPNTCPNCYTVADFCRDHPEGSFVLGTGTHAIAVIDGVIYDTWDSSLEIPVFYWSKEEL